MPSDFLLPPKQELGGLDPGGRSFILFTLLGSCADNSLTLGPVKKQKGQPSEYCILDRWKTFEDEEVKTFSHSGHFCIYNCKKRFPSSKKPQE
jgi:hypothetical protein